MLQTTQYSNFQIILLRCILSGYRNEEQIGRTLNTDMKIIKKSVASLIKQGLAKRHGIFTRKLRLTNFGMNLINDYDYMPDIQSAKPQLEMRREEIKQMNLTRTRTGSKLGSSSMIGIFTGWLIVGLLASAIYWAGYHFLIREYVPTEILSYVPLENPLIFVLLGLNTATAMFIPIKRQPSMAIKSEGLTGQM